MKRKQMWLLGLLVLSMLLAACGPEMATPTPAAEPGDGGELPVDADDWHALGEPDAPVTLVEYSDFQ